MAYNNRNVAYETFKAHSNLKDSLCVYSHDTIINDLVLCLSAGTHKMEKRIARLEFCLKFLDRVSDPVREAGNEILGRCRATHDDFVLIEDLNLDKLLTYKKKMNAVFPTAGTVPFEAPVNIDFHNHTKSVLNNNGYVYDIFTNIIIISFAHLRKSILRSGHENAKTLMQDAKLVFKGGAAIGKFVLSKPEILATMTDEEKEFLDSNFIRGGDNDTTVKFSNKSNLPSYIINAEIEALLKMLMSVVLFNIEYYNVQEIIKKELQKVVKSTFEYRGEYFEFQSRESKNFEIMDLKNNTSTINYTSEKKSQLFYTFSKLEFMNGDLHTEFFLGRIKAAFTATMCNPMHNVVVDGEEDDFSMIEFGNAISTYGELLDITACCVDNEISYKEEFDVIQF